MEKKLISHTRTRALSNAQLVQKQPSVKNLAPSILFLQDYSRPITFTAKLTSWHLGAPRDLRSRPNEEGRGVEDKEAQFLAESLPLEETFRKSPSH